MYQYLVNIAAYISISLLCSCGSTKQSYTKGYENDLLTVQHVTQCKEGHSGDAVDSRIGKIVCREATLTYDYGRYGSRGPTTAVEYFEEGFKNYHYSKFFELTHIDSKLHKVFVDSVAILSVVAASEVSEPTLHDCGTCNAVAKIDFLGQLFYYPTTVSAAQMAPTPDVELTMVGTELRRKIYETDTGQLAATLTPVPRKRKSNYLSISISTDTNDRKLEQLILRSIRLK